MIDKMGFEGKLIVLVVIINFDESVLGLIMVGRV